MDPITLALVAALSARITSGVTEVSKQAVVAAYVALKAAIQRKFGNDSDLAAAVMHLEDKPDSAGRQAVVQEEVAEVEAAQDPEIQALAETLIKLLKSVPEGAQAVGKYQVHVSGGKVGAIGDHAKVDLR